PRRVGRLGRSGVYGICVLELEHDLIRKPASTFRDHALTMAKGTPATSALAKAGVAFTLHEYDYDPNAERSGMQAAEALGVSPERLLKTLMAKAGDVVCVLVPSDREVSLKRLAAAAGAKQAEMLAPAQAERVTGYHVGGISPFGQRKRARV